MGDPDQRLVAEVLSDGNPKAFGRLVERYQTPVRGFLFRLVKGKADLADDLAQDTFLTAFRRLETYRGSGKFSSWLFRIAYTTFLQELRRSARVQEVELTGDEQGTVTPHDPTASIDLERAMAGLRKEERTAITLCYTYGMSHSEASTVLGLPLGTVKSHVERGKNKLRAILMPSPAEA